MIVSTPDQVEIICHIRIIKSDEEITMSVFSSRMGVRDEVEYNSKKGTRIYGVLEGEVTHEQ